MENHMPSLSPETVNELAELLENAELQASDVVKVTDAYPEMDYEDAYNIQDAIKARKLARGDKLSGLKMGLTSLAKMKQMGVEDPIRGFLVDYFACADGATIDTSKLIHPKIEAEVAFVLKTALEGPNVTAEEVLDATEYVVAALEIIDSRYENFRFDLRSVVADNCSSSRYVIGSRIARPRDFDLITQGVVMEKNGEVVQTGSGAAVLGDPALSVAMLAKMLHARGERIEAGTFILTGGVTAAVLVEPGDCITTKYQHLGAVTVRFE
jgi:2-oxo-3-hexenedioate decarboxylase